MRFQKFYFWFCIATWVFWGTAILLALSSGGAFRPYNMAFFRFAAAFCRIAFISCMIPLSPVLSIIAAIYALLRKHNSLSSLALWNLMLITPLLAFFLMASWAYVSGA